MAGVYLAYPIDQAWTRTVLADEIKKSLAESPRVSWIFDPGQSFTMGGNGDRTHHIRSINRRGLEESTVVVALLPKGSVSVGVPMEIERAINLGKPVIVVSEAPSWMLHFEPNEKAKLVSQWSPEALKWVERQIGWGTPGRIRIDFSNVKISREALGLPEAEPKTPLPVVAERRKLLPKRGYNDDAGLDLIVSQTTNIPFDSFVDVPCGVSVQLPDWAWGMITGRSSTLRKHGLLVNQGVIDAGYRGPLFAGVWNMTNSDVTVREGDRIAQLIVIENATRRLQVEQVEMLESSARGNNGFGSTGT